jgi:L-ascorbate metabolism protein UlaG (beta-lactamase superfamily)
VGGEFTIGPKQAVEVIQKFEPSYVIPMHYQTPNHPDHFAKLAPLADFLKEYGSVPVPQPKLTVERAKLPEETELAVLSAQLKSGE